MQTKNKIIKLIIFFLIFVFINGNIQAEIIINAGGYSHTSVAIMDALKTFEPPIIEVHMSNIYARENYRNYSYISSVVDGSICGLGYLSYELALESLIKLIVLK